jgi:hypothetical protein
VVRLIRRQLVKRSIDMISDIAGREDKKVRQWCFISGGRGAVRCFESGRVPRCCLVLMDALHPSPPAAELRVEWPDGAAYDGGCATTGKYNYTIVSLTICTAVPPLHLFLCVYCLYCHPRRSMPPSGSPLANSSSWAALMMR